MCITMLALAYFFVLQMDLTAQICKAVKTIAVVNNTLAISADCVGTRYSARTIKLMHVRI